MSAARPAYLVRPCFQQDVEYVQLIYAHHVMTGTASFETEPPSREEMEARWSTIVTNGWPYLAASPTSDLTRVVAFAYAQQFRSREAYRRTFEDSVYVAPGSTGKGIGKLLLAALLGQLKNDGAREVVAVIGDSANQPSISLHASLGFHHVGVLQRVGFKFDRWLDVVLMQRSLILRGEPV
jgi:phosphinothricin acetyltransferase